MKYKILLTVLVCSFITIANAQVTNYQRGLEAFNSGDFEKALKYMEPYAKDSNHCVAQYIIGFCYSNGNVEAANDSLAEHYLLLSSEQHFGRAMGTLAVYYFNNSNNDREMTIKALVWAELAALYDPVQSLASAKDMVRKYMNEEDTKIAEKEIADRKIELDKIEPCK